MPILYAVVARETNVLAKYASTAGNYSEVTEGVLATISPQNKRLTLKHFNYLFNYIIDDGLIYLCVTDDEFNRMVAFLFLEEVCKRFKGMYGDKGLVAVPYAMNTEFSKVLSSQIKHFSDNKSVDAVSHVQGELDELREIVVRNIDTIASRGERLELLVNKTENLSSTSVHFRKTSRNLAKSLFWKNVKITVIVIAVILIIFYLIVSMACGGLTWGNCI